MEPDADRLKELRAAVADARSRIRVEPVLTDGRLSDVRPIDPEMEAIVAGARERVEEADRALVAFERANDVGLVVERVDDRRAEGARLLATARAFLDAERDWHAGVLVEQRHARTVGREIPQPDYPALDALRELSAWVRRVEADPARLLPVPVPAREAAA